MDKQCSACHEISGLWQTSSAQSESVIHSPSPLHTFPYPLLSDIHILEVPPFVAAARVQAVFQLSGEQSARSVPYDLLVGADGVISAVRESLRAALPDFSVDVSDSGREYKARMHLMLSS